MEYGSFGRRALALILDALILIIPCMLLESILPVVGSILCMILYRPFFESSPLQATPGKAIMELAVVNDSDQSRISFRTALIRTGISFFSSLFLCLGYLLYFFTEKKQTLHDVVAQTAVVRRKPITASYFDVWVNQFKSFLNNNELFKETPVASTNKTQTLEDLYKLFQAGALTEEEYNLKKQEILKSI